MSRESRLVKKYSSRPKENNGLFGAGFTLPNHSGKHDAARYSLTDGSVPFIGGNKLTEDNSNLYWDSTKKWLGVGTNTPSGVLHIKAQTSVHAEQFFSTTGQTWKFRNNKVTGQFNIVNDTSSITPFKIDTTAPNNLMNLKNTGIGVGTASPAASALLELSSTTGALLVPRMTTTQRNALTAVNGMIIYNTTTNAFNFYEGSSWVTK